MRLRITSRSGREASASGFDQGLLAGGEEAGLADAIGRKKAGIGVDQHRFHAERVGDEAGVLAAGAAEAVEQIARHVIAALDGDFLDGVGHVFDGDGDEAFGDLLGRLAVADFGGERGELCL